MHGSLQSVRAACSCRTGLVRRLSTQRATPKGADAHLVNRDDLAGLPVPVRLWPQHAHLRYVRYHQAKKLEAQQGRTQPCFRTDVHLLDAGLTQLRNMWRSGGTWCDRPVTLAAQSLQQVQNIGLLVSPSPASRGPDRPAASSPPSSLAFCSKNACGSASTQETPHQILEQMTTIMRWPESARTAHTSQSRDCRSTGDLKEVCPELIGNGTGSCSRMKQREDPAALTCLRRPLHAPASAGGLRCDLDKQQGRTGVTPDT